MTLISFVFVTTDELPFANVSMQKEPSPGEPQYTDWWECMQDIVTKEGPQALFKGSLLRVLRTSPQFGITLMVYGILCDGS